MHLLGIKEDIIMATRRQVNETVKEAGAKVEEVKKAAADKAVEVKKAAEDKAVEVKKAAEDKVEEVMKTAEKKTEEVKKAAPAAAKKVAAKAKKAVAKKDIKTEIVLQYGEKEVNTKEIVAAVKKEWTKAKHKVSEIKSMELYLKPEDYAVYYVINGDTTGKIWM